MARYRRLVERLLAMWGSRSLGSTGRRSRSICGGSVVITFDPHSISGAMP
ncbi:MAG TPA: hypothetical protein VKM72_12560 [Thermoanaerobaculia bacterium]|nr:hypothetical protein [Thermoanaerobaculia bacterium]